MSSKISNPAQCFYCNTKVGKQYILTGEDIGIFQWPFVSRYGLPLRVNVFSEYLSPQDAQFAFLQVVNKSNITGDSNCVKPKYICI